MSKEQLDEEQIVWKLRKIAEDLFEDHPVLSDELCDVIQIIEAQQGRKRQETRTHITGLMLPLLQHVIQLKTLEENSFRPPETWEKEIESFRDQIQELNETSKFRSGFFFTEKELQSISEDEMKLSQRRAKKKLEQGWPDAKIPEDLKKARSAKDLGITFL